MLPERVNEAVEATLAQLAVAVETDLRFVGLPVLQTGDCWNGENVDSSTFIVFYDPSINESGGVFVTWSPSKELKQLVISSPSLAMERAVPLGGIALEAMLVAAEQILSAAGWNTDRSAVGVHESSIKLTRSHNPD